MRTCCGLLLCLCSAAASTASHPAGGPISTLPHPIAHEGGVLSHLSAGSSEAMKRIRAAILADYDRHVPPGETERQNTEGIVSETGTDVALQIHFFKVQSVRPAEGQMTIKVWLRMRWRDSRLGTAVPPRALCPAVLLTRSALPLNLWCDWAAAAGRLGP